MENKTEFFLPKKQKTKSATTHSIIAGKMKSPKVEFLHLTTYSVGARGQDILMSLSPSFLASCV